MSRLLSAVVAAAFAAASMQAIAQSKDVTTKSGGAVANKGGTNVTTKDMKDKPKPEKKAAAPKPKMEKPAKQPGAQVKTKSGGPVSDKAGRDVTGKAK